MEATPRRRALLFAGLTLGLTFLALILVAIAWGFGYGQFKWLITAGLVAAAAAMSASTGMRLVILTGDSQVRDLWWTRASPARRALWIVAMALRILSVIVFLYIAVHNLRG